MNAAATALMAAAEANTAAASDPAEEAETVAVINAAAKEAAVT